MHIKALATPVFRVFNKKLNNYRVTSGSHKHKFRSDMFYVEPGNPNFRIELMARYQGTINGGLFWLFAGDIILARTQEDDSIIAVVFVSDTEGIYADTGTNSYDLAELHEIEIINNANTVDLSKLPCLADAIAAYREEDHK